MIPKKSKEFIPEHAKTRNIPEEDLEDMVRGYYDAIRSKVINLEHIRVWIRGLGYLKIRNNQVDMWIEYLQKESVNNHVGYHQMEKNNDLLGRLNRVVEMRTKEWEKQDIQMEEKLLYKQKRMNK